MSHACTEIGCMDQLSATLRTADSTWPDGTYELIMRADDIEGTCTFRLPEELPSSPGAILGLNCGSRIRFELAPETKCEQGCDGQACWQSCTPIPGKFVQRVSVMGTPSRFEVTLLRDGVQLVMQDVQPVYRQSFPNGPKCGGACRQASLDIDVP